MSDYKIQSAPFLSNQNARLLFEVFHMHGYDLFFVGGCVRNAVMGCADISDDIDLTTSCPIDSMQELLKKHTIHIIKAYPEYGALTVKINQDFFEITSFRGECNHDGRHATIFPVGSMTQDASRRDFTFNALYCDHEGNIFDPIGSGINDALTGQLAFIGDPIERITEDSLRILRYYRFAAHYKSPENINEISTLISEHTFSFKCPSGARIRYELERIFNQKNSINVLYIMEHYKILSLFFDAISNVAFLEERIKLSKSLSYLLWIRLLFPVETLMDKKDLFYLTRSEKRILKQMALLKHHIDNGESIEYIASFYYTFPQQICDDSLLWANNKQYDLLLNNDFPPLNFTIQDIIKEGYQHDAISKEYRKRIISFLKGKV